MVADEDAVWGHYNMVYLRSLMFASPYFPALLALVKRNHTSDTNTATAMTI